MRSMRTFRPYRTTCRQPQPGFYFPLLTYIINRYDPRAWWETHGPVIADNSVFKILHGDDTKHPEFGKLVGWWAYVATGSGIGVRMGKSIQARNKIHALQILSEPEQFVDELKKLTDWEYETGAPI